jgi:hypothetical protein
MQMPGLIEIKSGHGRIRWLREKAAIPHALHGVEWPLRVWGMRSQVNLAFSLEEVPPYERDIFTLFISIFQATCKG